MSNSKKDKNQVETKEIDFDKIVKSLLTVLPKENIEIKEKAQKERKKKESK